MANLADLAVRVSEKGLDDFIRKGGRATKVATNLEKSFDKVSSSSRNTARANKPLVTETNKSTKSLERLNSASLAVGAGLLALGFGLTRFARQASAANIALERSVAEVSTLLDGTPEQIAQITSESLRLTQAFGGLPTAQAQAFYAAYSAGASNAAEATLLVESANRLAVGGVATLEGSIGLLSSTLNAYSAFGYTATEASDLFFIAVRNGITTIPLLASSLSNVSATAANFGVRLEILSAAIAGLTASGTPTAQATTQINSFILSLQRLSPEVKEFARAIGLSSTAPEDFAQVIQELNGILANTSSQSERTAILFKIFGTEVEALRAAASLTGGGFNTFQRTLKDTENAAGSTQVAYDKLANTMANQLAKAQGEVNVASNKFGEELNTFLVPALISASKVISVLAENIPILGGVIVTFATVTLAILIKRLIVAAGLITIITGGANLAVGTIAALTAGVGALAVGLGVGTTSWLNYNKATEPVVPTLAKITDAEKENTQAIDQSNISTEKATKIREALNKVENDKLRILRNQKLASAQNAFNAIGDIGQNGATIENVQSSLTEAFSPTGLASSIFGKASPFVTAISNTIPVLGAVASGLQLLKTVIGGTRVTGRGLNVNASADGRVSGNNFETSTATGLTRLFRVLGNGSPNRRSESALSFSQTYELERGIRLTRMSLGEYVEILGGDTSKGFSIAGANVASAVADFRNQFVGVVDGINLFQQSGESLHETLIRIVESTKDVNESLVQAGLTEFSRGGALLSGGLANANGIDGLGAVRGLRTEEELQAISRANFEAAINGLTSAPTGGFSQSVIDNLASDREAFLNFIDRQGRELDYTSSVLNQSLATTTEDGAINIRRRNEEQIAAFQAVVNLADDFRILNPDGDSFQNTSSNFNTSASILRNQFETEEGFNVAKAQADNIVKQEQRDNRRDIKLDAIVEAIQTGDFSIVNAIKRPTAQQQRAGAMR